MELTFSARTILDAAKRLAPAIPARNTGLPILSNALVTVTKGAISMRGSDLDLDLTIGVSGQASSDGKILLPIRRLAKFAATFDKDAPVHVESDMIGNDEWLRVTCDHITLNLAGSDVTDFPTFPSMKDAVEATIDFDALGYVLPAASNDPVRPILTGIHVNGNTTAATDSYRLYICESKTVSTDVTLLIPARAAKILARIGGERKVKVVDRKYFVYQAEGLTLCVALIDGEFPNWRSLIPTDQRDLMRFEDPEGFTPAMQRLSKIASGLGLNTSTPAVFEGDPIVVSITDQVSGASVKGTFLGSVTDKIAFNHRYMSEALDGADVQKIEGNGPLKPCILRWSDDRYNHSRLIMPVRIS